MSRIDAIFARHRDEGSTALMPFIVGGHPTLAATETLLPALEAAGASVVEIGIPFSDPIADGPVIAAAMHDALEAGATPGAIFDLVRRVRPAVGLGLVAMVSCSIVAREDPALFVARAAEAGIDGLIVPDVDLEDARRLRALCDAHDLAFAMLVAPTTRAERLDALLGICSGFVYLLARVGLTGERDAAPDVAEGVARIRERSDLPIAVGFGISRPEHVAAVTAACDAAIVGSALVRRMGEVGPRAVAAASEFVAALAAARSPHSVR